MRSRWSTRKTTSLVTAISTFNSMKNSASIGALSAVCTSTKRQVSSTTHTSLLMTFWWTSSKWPTLTLIKSAMQDGLAMTVAQPPKCFNVACNTTCLSKSRCERRSQYSNHTPASNSRRWSDSNKSIDRRKTLTSATESLMRNWTIRPYTLRSW